jgi:hypothetical protein
MLNHLIRSWIYPVAFLLISIPFLLFVSCDITGGCENTVLTEAPSPDGRLVATVFGRDCGATTATNTQICLRSRSVPFGKKEAESFFVVEGQGDVKVFWVDAKTVAMSFPVSMRVFHQDKSCKGINIQYSEDKK